MENFCEPSCVTSSGSWTCSACCSVFLLTCSVHCPGFPERHNTLVISVLIFIAAWSHAPENRSRNYWKHFWENISSTESSAKSNVSSCISQQWHTGRLGCDCLSTSCRIWRGMVRAPYRDSTLMARAQASEQEYSDLIPTNRWTSIPCSRNTPQKLFMRNPVVSFSISTQHV